MMRIQLLHPVTRWTLALALVLPSTLIAQNRSEKADQKACEKAAKIIAKGHPAKKEQDAFLTLSICGTVGANALASGLRQYENETDLEVLQDFMRQLDGWRDASIMDAATQLATNSSASPQARVFAVRHLLMLANPYMYYWYKGLTAGNTSRVEADGTEVTTIGCRAVMSSEKGDLVGTPLPADYVPRIRQTLTALANAASTPTAVRNAARCLD